MRLHTDVSDLIKQNSPFSLEGAIQLIIRGYNYLKLTNLLLLNYYPLYRCRLFIRKL